MKKIFITGANGFIGKSLCQTLSKLNRSVVGTVRSKNSFLTLPGVKFVLVKDNSFQTNLSQTLEDCEYIIHCAGKAHVMNKKDKLDDYNLVNTEFTKNLAIQAAKAGVKRLVFLSSVKVNGESTDEVSDNIVVKYQKNKVFTHSHLPKPEDPYSISKFEAEKLLWKVSIKTGLEVTVVRMPLVYGSGVKGNLERLIKFVKSGLPLPLGRVQNQRSMIGIDNLVDLLIRCIEHPDAAGKTFLVSDGEDLSTPDLINHIASSMGRRARLFDVPIFLLKIAGCVLGKKKEIDRLIGSLKIDNSYTREVLNWTPPVSVTEGIRRMIQDK